MEAVVEVQNIPSLRELNSRHTAVVEWVSLTSVDQPCSSPLTASIEPFEQKLSRVMHILAETATVATNPVILDVALEMSSNVLQHGFTSAGPHCRQTHAEGL